jgi:hypothetical protein
MNYPPFSEVAGMSALTPALECKEDNILRRLITGAVVLMATMAVAQSVPDIARYMEIRSM